MKALILHNQKPATAGLFAKWYWYEHLIPCFLPLFLRCYWCGVVKGIQRLHRESRVHAALRLLQSLLIFLTFFPCLSGIIVKLVHLSFAFLQWLLDVPFGFFFALPDVLAHWNRARVLHSNKGHEMGGFKVVRNWTCEKKINSFGFAVRLITQQGPDCAYVAKR